MVSINNLCAVSLSARTCKEQSGRTFRTAGGGCLGDQPGLGGARLNLQTRVYSCVVSWKITEESVRALDSAARFRIHGEGDSLFPEAAGPGGETVSDSVLGAVERWLRGRWDLRAARKDWVGHSLVSEE